MSPIRRIEKLHRAIEIIIQEADHRGLDWQGDAELVITLIRDVADDIEDEGQGIGNAARCRRYRMRHARAANKINGSDMIRHDSDMPATCTMSQESSPSNGSSLPLRKVSPKPPSKESPLLFSLTSPSENAISRQKIEKDFAAWWQKVPHKIGKRAAEAAYERALKRGAAPEQLLAGLERYIATKPADRPWCNPTTYLNQDRYLDEPAPLPLSNGHDHRGWSERCSRCGCTLSEENRARGRCRYCF